MSKTTKKRSVGRPKKERRPPGRPRLPESEGGLLIQSVDAVRRKLARAYQRQYRENKRRNRNV